MRSHPEQLKMETDLKEKIDRIFREGDECPLSDLRPNIQALFRAWYPTNMQCVVKFYDTCKELKYLGRRQNYSSQMIIHKMRWDSAIESHFDKYKINQNLGSALGRVVMVMDLNLKGMFRKRR